MTVLDVKETHRQTEGRAHVEGAADSRAFDVVLADVTSIAAGKREALTASGVPVINSAHPADSRLWLDEVVAVPRSLYHYDVFCHYSSAEGGWHVHPTHEKAIPRWNVIATEEPVDFDIYGAPIVNSAGEAPDPPLLETFYDMVLTVERNESDYDPIAAHPWHGAVNTDLFLGFAAGTAKCVRYTADLVRNVYTYYQVSYEFHFRVLPVAWQRRLLDRGFRELTGTDDDGRPVYTNATDAAGKTISEPILLDGAGRKLTTDGAAVYKNWETKIKLPFADLNLADVLDK